MISLILVERTLHTCFDLPLSFDNQKGISCSKDPYEACREINIYYTYYLLGINYNFEGK